MNFLYVIFVDKSDSINEDSIRSDRKDLQNDNMIGAIIEAIFNYCAGKKPKEKCTLIDYESVVNLVFEDVPITEIDIIKDK